MHGTGMRFVPELEAELDAVFRLAPDGDDGDDEMANAQTP